MMFGLTCAHAAGAIAMVMVGMRLEVSPGHYLVNDEMLNGVVIMILITCIISTMMTEKAAQELTLAGTNRLAVSGVGLNVVYDDVNASSHREAGLQLLERLQQRASAADLQMQTQVRLSSNIANGIKHAFREFGCSEIIMGMHVHTDVNPKFWGEFLQSLYNGLNRQIVLTRFVQPLNTLRRIQVAVPSRAEFEPGFHRWLERLARMSTTATPVCVLNTPSWRIGTSCPVWLRTSATTTCSSSSPPVRVPSRIRTRWSVCHKSSCSTSLARTS